MFKLVFLSSLVISVPAQPLMDRNISCLKTLLYNEARYESTEGKIAVINVVQNRAKVFNTDFCNVIYQRNQFFLKKEFKLENKYDVEIDALSRHYYILPNIVGQSLFFKRRKHPSRFFKKLKKIKKIGNHEFFQ
jgi:spore germination cell wall hydrolase CwlJ-like protein